MIGPQLKFQIYPKKPPNYKVYLWLMTQFGTEGPRSNAAREKTDAYETDCGGERTDRRSNALSRESGDDVDDRGADALLALLITIHLFIRRAAGLILATFDYVSCLHISMASELKLSNLLALNSHLVYIIHVKA